MANGILPLYKPAGITSMEAVRRVKRATKDQKVGHGGTLDPIAAGILPIFFGNATRTMEYLIDGTKVYQAQVMLGVTTDSYDSAGEVVARADASGVTREQVEAALTTFTGTISQVPPMFSALKRQGQPLYELAREGYETAREPRRITVTRITMTTWAPPTFGFEVECGRGTYVRSLAHDLGQALGCGGHLTGLIRSQSGPFTLNDTVQLEAFEQAAKEGQWETLLHPADKVLTKFVAVTVTQGAAVSLSQGQHIPLDVPTRMQHGDLCRIYLADGTFVGLVQLDAPSGLWQPIKIFSPVRPEKVITS